MFCLLQPFFKKILRCATKLKFKYVCAFMGFLMILDIFGAFTHIFEIPYTENFAYPYNGDIQPFVDALRNNRRPEMEPINVYNYTIIQDPKDRCVDPDSRILRIAFFVKSAAENFERRNGIRQTWGFGKRFFDVPTRLIFLLGTHTWDSELDLKIKDEATKYKDILQADFVDTYFNNTIKTMMGFKWAVEHCRNAKFYMFVDDDMYVSVKNVLRFVRNPNYYPDYLKEPSRMAHKREIKDADMRWDSDEDENFHRKINESASIELSETAMREQWNKVSSDTPTTDEMKISKASLMSMGQAMGNLTNNSTDTANTITRRRRQVFDFELPEDVRLFAGYVFVSSPHRHKTSKWYVSLNEYPYHLWPPYVTAGAYIMSKEALIDMYYASLYTQHFRFDDIFLAIVAKKADIEPFHCNEFHFYKKDYTKYNYKYVITSHGYEDPRELIAVWQEQKSLGNA